MKNISEDNTQKLINRIRFIPLKTDAGAVYEKLWNRIMYETSLVFGVSRIWKYISIAASIALMLVSSLFIYSSLDRDIMEIAYLEVSTMPGSKTRIELPDSSIVWLNSKSKIRYPQKFANENRIVEFDGEALFEVKKDVLKPFIVIVDGMSVKVLGTQFNILADADSDIVETTLLEGSVALYASDCPSNTPEKILNPNQQAIFNKKSRHLDIYNVRGYMYSSWVDGIFIFEKNTLQEIVNVLQRAFDTKIHLDGEELRNQRLTAQFTHQETLDEILSILQISARYTYKKEKGEIYMNNNIVKP
ncbi:hypothetical protein FACS189415_5090 [Bacteroidia bacterium]|nr:hypothetical protein FACS189415_5090 [Bacteroidia bacterium]